MRAATHGENKSVPEGSPLARALVVHHALERRIATMSTLARHFGRSASTLRETLERYRNSRPELFKAPLKLP